MEKGEEYNLRRHHPCRALNRGDTATHDERLRVPLNLASDIMGALRESELGGPRGGVAFPALSSPP